MNRGFLRAMRVQPDSGRFQLAVSYTHVDSCNCSSLICCCFLHGILYEMNQVLSLATALFRSVSHSEKD